MYNIDKLLHAKKLISKDSTAKGLNHVVHLSGSRNTNLVENKEISSAVIFHSESGYELSESFKHAADIFYTNRFFSGYKSYSDFSENSDVSFESEKLQREDSLETTISDLNRKYNFSESLVIILWNIKIGHPISVSHQMMQEWQ